MSTKVVGATSVKIIDKKTGEVLLEQNDVSISIKKKRLRKDCPCEKCVKWRTERRHSKDMKAVSERIVLLSEPFKTSDCVVAGSRKSPIDSPVMIGHAPLEKYQPEKSFTFIVSKGEFVENRPSEHETKIRTDFASCSVKIPGIA